MQGLKQTQMKFIIVKLAFKKAAFPPLAAFLAGVFLFAIARLTLKMRCNHFWLKKVA